MWDAELAGDMVLQATASSYHQNCPARVALFPRTVLWWKEELCHFKDSTRQLCKIQLKE